MGRLVGSAARLAGVIGLTLGMVAFSGGEAPAYQVAGMGYTCMDSEEVSPNAPVFAWDEASGGTATNVVGDDNFGTFPIPFAFTYDGTPQVQISIATNGFTTFGGGNATFTNQAIPTAGAPAGLVAVFWDDMNVTVGNMMTFSTFGTAPNRRFVVQWSNLPHLGGAANVLITMQVAFFETSNAIRMQYMNVSGTNGGGQSATVGIENNLGNQGIQYMFNNSIPTNNISASLAIGYWPTAITPPWAAPPPPPPGGGGGGGGGGGITLVDVDDDEKSRSHRFCGGSSGVSGSLLGLSCVLALGLGLFAGRRAS